MEIRQIPPAEAEHYWALRLQALCENPEAFGSSYEESVERSMESVRDSLAASDYYYVLGAYASSDELAGMVGFRREVRNKLRHKATVFGVYVASAYRSQGVGRALLEDLIDRSRRMAGLAWLHLYVVATNDRARSLYLSLGFQVYGTEKDSLRYNGQSFDQELMALPLHEG